MRPQVKETLTQYANGLVTKQEMHAELEKLQVRGDAELGSYMGYDSREQAWVQVHFYDLKS